MAANNDPLFPNLWRAGLNKPYFVEQYQGCDGNGDTHKMTKFQLQAHIALWSYGHRQEDVSYHEAMRCVSSWCKTTLRRLRIIVARKGLDVALCTTKHAAMEVLVADIRRIIH